MGQQNQNPSQLGKISKTKGNPYRSPRALFMGQETAEEKALKALADQWDVDHPNGVEE